MFAIKGRRTVYLLLPLSREQLGVLVASGEGLDGDEVVGDAANRSSRDASQHCKRTTYLNPLASALLSVHVSTILRAGPRTSTSAVAADLTISLQLGL